jgi:glycogen debranching enzyme
VARDESVYNPMQMWRGPTWINVNYLLVEGLERSGFPAIAAELRQRTLDMLVISHDIQEYYNPETGSPCQLAAPQFGWSAALFIDMALQDAREKKKMG